MGQTRVCVISSEIVGPHANGGIGTHCYYLSAFLSQQLGQAVTFLYTGKIERRTEGYWRDWFRQHLGVEFVALPLPGAMEATPASLRSSFVQTARNVYDWLRDRDFDVCHFQEMLGNGFRCFQAKRLGLAFQHTVLTCTVHSSWEWICQAMQTFPQSGMEELQTKFMERYCIEHCDQLISPSQYMLDWLERNHLNTPAQKRVLPYLFAPELRAVGHRPANGKIIFFGRLEVRKGLLLFLEALRRLDQAGSFASQPVEVFFLGKSGYTPDGGGSASIEKLRPGFSSAVQLKPVTELGHRQAMEFLSANNDALVVCPSLVDNSPYAVIESLQLGLNLVAARSGGIPELFAGTERLFEPDPDALAAKLQAGLRHQLPPPSKRYDLEKARQLWRDFSETIFSPASPTVSPAAPVAKIPPLHVLISGDAPEPVLEGTLTSLEGQTWRNFSATVVSSGKLTSALEAKCRSHGWAIRERRSDLMEAHVAPNAPKPQRDGQGELAVFLTPGCVLESRGLETMAQCVTRSGLEALVCCGQVNGNVNGGPGFAYEPLGACVECGIHTNLFGTGCVMTRSIPGLEPLEGLLRPAGIWAYLARLSIAGRAWDVCPEFLMTLDPAFLYVDPGHLTYREHLGVVTGYSEQEPEWWRYLLLNQIASQRNGVQLPQSSDASPRRSVLFKVKRETSRLLKQCRSLFRRP